MYIDHLEFAMRVSKIHVYNLFAGSSRHCFYPNRTNRIFSHNESYWLNCRDKNIQVTKDEPLVVTLLVLNHGRILNDNSTAFH